MIPAVDAARFLIRLASPIDDEDADCLCHMRLQKLLYYAQGWHLAAYGKPLFSGRIEAWQHGPVVREVYPEFKRHGCAVIPPAEGAEPGSISERDKIFLRQIWEQYKQHSATALRALTHREQPWQDAYKSARPDGHCETEITPESLRAYFTPLLRERILRGNTSLSPALWDNTAAAISKGRVRSIEELRRDLHHRRPGTDA